MTQNVMTQAVNLFGNQAGKVKPKGRQENNGFDRIMDSNMQKASSTNEKSSSSPEKEINDTGNGEKNAKELKKSEIKPTTNLKTKAKGSTDVATKDIENDVELVAKVASLLQSVKDTVMEILNISAEELNTLLIDQGKNLVDMIDTDVLKQLVLNSSGESNIATVLIDENLASKMNHLLQSVNEIMENANLSITQDQLKTILSQLEKEIESNDPIEQGDLPKETLVAQSTTKNFIEKPKDEEETLEPKENLHKEIHMEMKKLDETNDSNSQSNKDSSREKSSEDKSQNQVNQFLDNLVSTVQNNQIEFVENVVQMDELRDIANQIIDRIKVVIKSDETSMELQLNPEHLGKVNLMITSKNGVMTAQFLVQNETTKEAIESQMQTLRDSLNQQGLKVEAIEVTVSNFSFEQSDQANANDQQQKEQQRRNLTLEEISSFLDVTEEETIRKDIMELNGSSVDYTA